MREKLIELLALRFDRFPIPMRGNEQRADKAEQERDEFPIPMRGNETLIAVLAIGPNPVSDPHEG